MYLKSCHIEFFLYNYCQASCNSSVVSPESRHFNAWWCCVSLSSISSLRRWIRSSKICATRHLHIHKWSSRPVKNTCKQRNIGDEHQIVNISNSSVAKICIWKNLNTSWRTQRHKRSCPWVINDISSATACNIWNTLSAACKVGVHIDPDEAVRLEIQYVVVVIDAFPATDASTPVLV